MAEEDTAKSNAAMPETGEISDLLTAKGVYTLIIWVPSETRIDVGQKGSCRFPRGYYAYTGSARGKGALSLGGRVLRHLRRDKKKHWHIDYLLSAGDVAVVAAVSAQTNDKMECPINRHLRDRLQAKIVVAGFGSSDCSRRCGSHLLYLGIETGVARKIATLYSEKINSGICVFNLC